MADDHQPTLGEVYRLLLSMQQTIDRMAREAREDRDHTSRTYVRQDVNDATMREVRDDIAELKDNWRTQKGRNQQIVIGVATGFIVLLIGIMASALGFPGGGGV